MKSKNSQVTWSVGAGVVLIALIVSLFVFLRTTPAPDVVAESSAPGQGPETTANPAPVLPQKLNTTGEPASDGARVGAILESMTLAEKVGQVLMVSVPVTGMDSHADYALADLGVGNFFMKGRSVGGQGEVKASVKAAKLKVPASNHLGVEPFVATDQEGGLVQIMQGPGFDRMPQAIDQGKLSDKQLKIDATQWGKQLAAVGVNVNLGPVLDTVPGHDFAKHNAPIGYFGRSYGYTTSVVSSHGVAFAEGMMDAGVGTAVKHFPGLGRVTENTDVSEEATDRVTRRNDPFLVPFRDAVSAGTQWLMISNAFYPKIDAKNLAPFSPTIVGQMVRSDLAFKGIVISDDICDAVQVSAVPLAQRAVKFIAAGGTMALCTNQKLMPAMYQGVLTTAQKDKAFAAEVNGAAKIVLEAKLKAGLLPK